METWPRKIAKINVNADVAAEANAMLVQIAGIARQAKAQFAKIANVADDFVILEQYGWSSIPRDY